MRYSFSINTPVNAYMIAQFTRFASKIAAAEHLFISILGERKCQLVTYIIQNQESTPWALSYLSRSFSSVS